MVRNSSVASRTGRTRAGPPVGPRRRGPPPARGNRGGPRRGGREGDRPPAGAPGADSPPAPAARREADRAGPGPGVEDRSDEDVGAEQPLVVAARPARAGGVRPPKGARHGHAGGGEAAPEPPDERLGAP